MNQNKSRNYKKYNSKNPLMGIVIANFIKNLNETVAPLENINNVIDIGCGEQLRVIAFKCFAGG